MTLATVEVTANQLSLGYPGMQNITVNIPTNQDLAEEVETYDVCRESCKGLNMGVEVGSWLSEAVLGDPDAGLSLLYHPRVESSRPDKQKNLTVAPNMKPTDKPYYADLFPYLLISQASINGLNNLLDEENSDLVVEEKRFRPNILIDGDFPPFSEDSWPYIKIGEVLFRNIMACDRCVFTTVDPQLGDKDPRGEPLRTLRKHRAATDPQERKEFGSAPLFGVLMASENRAEVLVGDTVSISKYL